MYMNLDGTYKYILKLPNITLLYRLKSISLFQRRQKTEKERAETAGKKTWRKEQPISSSELFS